MKKYILITALLLFSLISYAQSAASKLQANLANFKSMQANFKQTVVDANGQVLQTASGHMMISRPGKFYWHIETPMEQIIITDGKKLWVYEPDLEQMTVQNLQTSVSQTPVVLLTHTHAYLAKHFDVVERKANVFELLAKQPDANFKLAELTFSHQYLSKMRIDNQLGQHTIIEFSDVKMNPQFKTGTFTIDVPSTVDVIDQTKAK